MGGCKNLLAKFTPPELIAIVSLLIINGVIIYLYFLEMLRFSKRLGKDL